ncbi:DUF4433 domain-containing protein [Pseudomonas sp. N040]|uniref:DUF4433 domain-containing protein n=1 Tax=Pseudomonas sp. N040 TaxID=2785325 RepID=UPI0018A26E19|nr:DUF4433 domain-containing protein [Pseudomonas sp. N040]MBF7728599.1 DUF4433 domain-containing protein [Pseudomonas sp. N040]MBW7012239.1 DUF4433 domain-containing protein [Pseudomonas sp. N040]
MKSSELMQSMLEGMSPMPGLPPCLYYMMPLENFQTVRKHGLVSRSTAIEKGLHVQDYSDQEVQARRARRYEPIFQRCLHDYVPLYLNPRNPMLYSLRDQAADLVVLGLSPSLLDYHDQHCFTDGNAASELTLFAKDPSVIEPSLQALKAAYWNDVPDGKRRRCAEVLVAPSIAPGFIEVAICSNAETAAAVNDSGLNLDDRLIVDPGFFFAGAIR